MARVCAAVLTVQCGCFIAESHVMLKHASKLLTRRFPPLHPYVLELVRVPARPQDLHQICSTKLT
jgi:hypothetical protein